MSRRVAVVGAGIAGLSAARRMAEAGWEVVVFDKARGVGGRTATRRRDTDAFDHGAQYFTCRSDGFDEQVEDWCDRGVAAVWDAPICSLEDGQVLASTDQLTRYVGAPRMSVLARDLATDLRIEFQRRIESVDRSGRRWQLRSEVGLELEDVDAVIVATPAPQAVPLLAAAPGLARLAAGIEMLPCQAVMTTFGESPQVDFGGAFVSNSPLGWVARNASKPGRPAGECWVLHATPQWSAAHLEDSSEAVTESLLRALARALGRELPKVRSHRVHRWRFARTEKPLGSPYLWEAEAGLGVCGDWLHGSRVEDAFTSGELLARAMLGGPKRA